MANNPTWPLEWVHEETPLSAENLNLMVTHIRDAEISLNNLDSKVGNEAGGGASATGLIKTVRDIEHAHGERLGTLESLTGNNEWGNEILHAKLMEARATIYTNSSLNNQLLRDDIDDLKETVNDDTKGNNKLRAELNTLNSVVEDTTIGNNALDTRVGKNATDISDLSDAHDKLNDDYDNSVIEFNQAIESLGAQTSTIEGDVSTLKTNVDTLQTSVKGLDDIVNDSTKGNEKLRDDIKEMQETIMGTSGLGALNAQVTAIDGSLSYYSSSITELRSAVGEPEEGNASLYAEVNGCRDSIGYLIGRDTDVKGYMDALGDYASTITDLTNRVEALEDGSQGSSGTVTPSAGIEVYTNAWFKSTAAGGGYDNNTSAASVKFVQSAVSKHGIDDGSID